MQSARKRFGMSWVLCEETSCWIWIAGLRNEEGYGRFKLGGRSYPAHRYGWELYRGAIPHGMHIDHLCRVRSCVNPDHLRVVTPQVNALENSLSPLAKNAAKKNCPRCAGEYTKRQDGTRHCVPCKRQTDSLRRTERMKDPAYVALENEKHRAGVERRENRKIVPIGSYLHGHKPVPPRRKPA